LRERGMNAKSKWAKDMSTDMARAIKIVVLTLM
jgi:hypothetical protein